MYRPVPVMSYNKLPYSRLAVKTVSQTHIHCEKYNYTKWNQEYKEHYEDRRRPGQETQGVSDGYFVMLEPLPRGEHEIRSVGSLTEVTVQGTQNFASDVTYHITAE